MRVLVADDEAPARRALGRLLAQLGSEVVAEAETGLDVLALVSTSRPDVILLDIAMPELDGIELAARYAHLPPIVFVTAHDEHAVRAFELDAVDYLLKPVRLERLAAALHRVASRRVAIASGPPRVSSQVRGTIRVFDATTIDRYHSIDKYTAFVVDGVEHLTDEPLSALEQRLGGFGFLRVHRAELVRIAAIRALTSDPEGHVVALADGQSARVSRRSVGAVKAALGL